MKAKFEGGDSRAPEFSHTRKSRGATDEELGWGDFRIVIGPAQAELGDFLAIYILRAVGAPRAHPPS